MKQVIALSGLLAVALLGSYLTWTADPSGAAPTDQIPLYTASQADLRQIVWDSERHHLVLTRPSDAAGEHIWVVDTERRQVPIVPSPAADLDEADPTPEADDPSPDADDPSPDEAEPPEVQTETVVEVTAFLGSQAAHTLWEAFTPLHAMRKLGTAQQMDLSALGFDEPQATLTITRGSGDLQLVVGGESYGSKDRYVRMGESIYLVDDSVLRSLQFGSTRLVERGLQPLGEQQLQTVEIALPDGRSLQLHHQHRDDRARAFWATPNALDVADDTAGTWLGKLFRMRVNGYLTEDKLDGPLEPIFAYSVSGEGQRWQVEVFRGAEDGREQIYARSSFNRSLVRLTRSLADEAIADLPSLFGG